MKGNCEICGKEIEITMCCSGRDCGCLGLPIDPPVCSEKCYEKYEEKRKNEAMKEKLIELIGFGMEPERAEIKANQIIVLFNEMIIEKMKEVKHREVTFDDIASLFIDI